MDNEDWQLPPSFRDMYGLVMIEGPSLTLFNPNTGRKHFTWNVMHFARFEIPKTESVQDKDHVIRTITTK